MFNFLFILSVIFAVIVVVFYWNMEKDIKKHLLEIANEHQMEVDTSGNYMNINS